MARGLNSQLGRVEAGAGPSHSLRVSGEFAERLANSAPSRLTETLGALVLNLHNLIENLRLTPAELRAAIEFLTEVGHSADPRRQEWVLLADAMGLTALLEDLNHPRPSGATPNTVAGPFYRDDAPDLPDGATISRDGKGEPLTVRGQISSLTGEPVAGALVEVWQANAEGKYENQEPDHQPEYNLRGKFRTDSLGRFSFRSVMPRGYALPADGPVGRLMNRLGMCLERPAHLHFRVSAKGHETLVTHLFDKADPAIGRDAIFGVKPELLADFRAVDPLATGRRVDVNLVLCPRRQGQSTTEENT
ncbi:dioxygenase [Pseudotabrizicola algicola]|uniref:6-chlorohydroxyquinol-1,2-dioxygenase n=1 Tax=Pseudotabrizicola algicola TaxID=2709381 RepID=A0A6B3RRP4_9RHOB|nr:dioxygenase [Pseudotabrizicola algicola]NEX46665.1 6-chlorohydroxyquinol-1,2-dioxygenase [Pseudotabrizicola algicola]